MAQRAATSAARRRAAGPKTKARTRAAKQRPPAASRPSGSTSHGAASRPRPAKRPAGKKQAAKRGAARTASRRPHARPRAAARSDSASRRRLPRLPGGWRSRLAVLVVLALAAGSAYAFWLRDSSLLAVDRVHVEGLESPDSDAIAGRLRATAEQMTTLNLERSELEAAVEGFPSVRSIGLDAHLPNGVTIEVDEAPPTMIAEAGERRVPVAADGELLLGASTEGLELPAVAVDELPAAGRLSDAALEQALVVGAAPEPLRAIIAAVDHDPESGVHVALEEGVELEFGASADAAEKWEAAAAVMADGRLEALAYIDLRVPDRPAVG